MSDTLAPPAFVVPRYTAHQARRDYAQREAERYRQPIKELWHRGIRRPGELAAALNGRDLLAPTGRPWAPRTMAALLKLLRFDRHADAQRDAAVLEELVEELWAIGYRIPLQLGGVLARLEVVCPWGGPWTAGKADRLIQRHAGEWMADGAKVRLRHATDALKLSLEGFAELPAIGRVSAAQQSAPAPQETALPQAPRQRVRGIRMPSRAGE